MAWILLKNNLKLMLRNKGILLAVTLMPVLVTVLLSSVFEEMLGSYTMSDEIKVGYSVPADSAMERPLEMFAQQMKEKGYYLTKYDTDDIGQTVKTDELTAFAEINDRDYTLYMSQEKSKEAKVVRKAFSSFLYQLEHMQDLSSQPEIGVDVTRVYVVPMASSKDYYGIIEIVYFAMIGIVSLAIVISSERKNQVVKRMKIAKVGVIPQFFGKLIPCTVATFIECCTGAVVTVVLVRNHWGEPLKSIGILFLVSLFASCLGLFALSLFHNIAISIVTTFTTVWFMGFFGGSFENYMQLGVTEKTKLLSPMYYANRTLVEYRTMGQSDYTVRCVVILLIASILLSLATILLMKYKKEA